MLFVSVIVYVIFDNNSSDGKIGNELTIIVEIMIGLFIATIIQYNQYKNQKKINDEKEKHRTIILKILYGLIIFIPLPVLSILKCWESLQNLTSDERNKKIMNAVLESNKNYFELEKQLVPHITFINPTNLSIFNTSKITYNACFSRIQNNPNSKEEIEKLVKHYEICLILIPNEYRDKEIDLELIRLLEENNT